MWSLENKNNYFDYNSKSLENKNNYFDYNSKSNTYEYYQSSPGSTP